MNLALLGVIQQAANEAFGAYELIDEIEVSADATTVSFTGLSLNEDDEILLVADHVNDLAGNTGLYLSVNSLTAITNYYRQLLTANDTALTTTRANNNFITFTTAGEKSLVFVEMKLTEGGYFTCQAYSHRDYDGISLRIYNNFIVATTTQSGITSITITARDSNGISSGSHFWLYKKGES